MIKLIVTDIDGTLVKDGSADINAEIFEVINRLKDKGTVFAAASGRQYPSIRRLFDPVHSNMIFIAENGAYIKCRDVEMAKTIMNKELSRQLITEVREIPDIAVTISTPEIIYIEKASASFMDLLINGYHNNAVAVNDIFDMDFENMDIIKIALYKEDGIRNTAETILIPKWKDKLKVVMAGAEWLDFMDLSVDKGNAIASIQKALSISEEETMVFGDNINDIGMMSRAKESYAVATARDEVKAAANHIAPPYSENGVLSVIKKLL